MKKAVMYGAGNIGRGFIGQLMSLSGYEVVFLDINDAVIQKLNEDGRYPLRLVSAAGAGETWVEHVRGVNSLDTEAAAGEIASADLMATAVGANILPRIAPVIAAGLKLRWRRGNRAPLNIIICENLMNAHRVLESLLLGQLDAALHGLFRETVGLVEASVGRMVPVTTPEMQQGNILRVWAEPYAELPVDRDGFRGAIPALSGLLPFSPFAFYIERKLFMHNMSHAVLAYLGRLAGHEFIWQAVRDERVASAARAALGESAAALARKHGVSLNELSAFSDDLLRRFDNPLLGDTAARVGRDPARKLGRDDRLVGAALLCLDTGVRPAHICRGIAAALRFDEPGDEGAARVQASLGDVGLEGTLERFCALDGRSPLLPMIREEYGKL
jgi:mannitol-1-phosphate 5-dehydrogenase